MKREITATAIALLLEGNAAVLAATNYVDLGSTAPAAPYTSWATAATNIQDAVAVAAAGATVLVANGIYEAGSTNIGGVGNRVAVNKALALRSLNGPDATIIAGEANVRCLWLADGASAEGFTLTNGHSRSSGGFGDAQSGGGAWCAGSAVVSNCIVKGCYAFYAGAGVYGGVLYDCTISDCDYPLSGGGAYTSTLHRCTLEGNWASSSGGGATHCVLYDCNIFSGGAQGGGGAWRSTLYRCTVAGNWAQLGGGGIADSDAFECALGYNVASYGGGAESGLLENCFLSGNEADDGGGTYSCDLANCTVVDNAAEESGGGVYRGTATNSIIYHNTAPAGINHADLESADSCCTVPAPASGSGHVAADPQILTFINPHLALGSPCIDAGNSAAAGTKDIDGDSRTIGAIDIGCDEFNAAGATGVLAVAITVDPTFAQTGFPIMVETAIDGIATGYSWNFGDGSGTSNLWKTSHAYAAPGAYGIICTATNFAVSVSATTTVEIVFSATAYVSLAGSHTEPFGSWATAATNLQTAVDIVAAGGEVIVADGIYEAGIRVTNNMPNRMLVDKAITVRSLNGPGATLVRGQGPQGANAVRCVYLGPSAVLVGFGLTNGHTHSSGDYKECNGGGVYCVPGAVLSNCVVSGCSSHWDGAGAYKCIAYDCAIGGNTAGDDGGGAYKSTLYGCAVADNVSGDHGGGLDQGEATRCVFSGNKASGSGGGAYNSTLRHCALFGNESAYRGGGASGGELHHCSVAGNDAATAGGVYNCDVYSSIVHGNTAGTAASNYYGSAYSKFLVSCTAPDPGWGENITSAPRYVDAPAGNLRLRLDSPCIDSGTNWTSDATDLDGHPRPSNTALWDMGAYEYNAAWSDSDGDIMADGWESDYFGGWSNAVASANPDSDPHGNLAEYIAGTDPTNSGSFFHVANTWQDVAGFVVEWEPSSSNREYSILWTNVLSTGFQTLETGIEFPRSSYTDTVNGAQSEGFYRIEVQLKP